MRDSFDFVLVLSRQLIVLEIDLPGRSEEHTSELQSRLHLVCRLLLEKKKRQSHGGIFPLRYPKHPVSRVDRPIRDQFWDIGDAVVQGVGSCLLSSGGASGADRASTVD